MKIAIVGYSGSGKSTLARNLSEYIQAPCLYLDTVQFMANWQERPREEAMAIVEAFMAQPSWVIDGNYRGFFQKERLASADLIIYMKFSRLTCLLRAFRRYLEYRNTTRESMAEDCLEKFDFDFFMWILKNGRTKAIRAHYKEIEHAYRDKIKVIHNQSELDDFFEAFKHGLNSERH